MTNSSSGVVTGTTASPLKIAVVFVEAINRLDSLKFGVEPPTVPSGWKPNGALKFAMVDTP